MKKLIVILGFVIFTSLLSFAFTYQGIEYEVLDEIAKTCEVSINNNLSSIENGEIKGPGDIVLPSTVYNGNKAYKLVAIGGSAFAGCRGLTSVIIPNSVKTIKEEAFIRCYELVSVSLPNSLTEIRAQAFAYCFDLTSIKIPDSVTIIGYCAFQACTSLTKVDIPSSVELIDSYAFSSCDNLLNIFVDNNNPKYASKDGILYNKDLSLLIQYPDGRVGAFEIPDFVTEIEAHAFLTSSSLSAISIPNTITYLGPFSLGSTGLRYVTLPNSIDKISSYLFSTASNLITVTIPQGITEIGLGAFQYCPQLNYLELPNSVTKIENQAFYQCENLTKLYCFANDPAECTEKAFNSFENTELHIPIGSKIAYENHPVWSKFKTIIDDLCNFESDGVFYKSLPGSEDSIEVYYIAENYFGDLVLPESIKFENIDYSVGGVGNNAFKNCSGLSSIVLPSSIKRIGASAFYNCCNLENIYLSEFVEEIGVYAFSNCSRLKNFYSYSSNPPICAFENVFEGIPESAILNVPYGSKEKYSNALGWSKFKIIVEGFDDSEGGIETIFNTSLESPYFYDLTGKKYNNKDSFVQQNRFYKGIHIFNGRKIMIK